MSQGMMGAGTAYGPGMNSMHGMMNQGGPGPYPMGTNMANNTPGQYSPPPLRVSLVAPTCFTDCFCFPDTQGCLQIQSSGWKK